MTRIVTASPLRAIVQEPSHGAGHTRPVNSGKLFVWYSLTAASCHCPFETRPLKSGMRLLMGQPIACPETIFPV